MSQFIDTNGTLFQVALIVQATLVLFFFIAPLTGLVLTRTAQKKADLTLVMGFMLLVFNALFAGITYLLQTEVAEDAISDDVAGIIGLIAAFAIAVLVGAYLRFVFIHQPRTALEIEQENLDREDQDSGTLFDQRRRERLKKRAQRRGR